MPTSLLHEERQGLIAHAGRGSGAVGNVDSVDADRLDELRPLDLFADVDSLGGHDFDHGDEFASSDLGAQAGALLKRNAGRNRGARRMSNFGMCGVGARFPDAESRLHGADVIGGGSAASAHQLDAGSDKFFGVIRHVLWRTQINVAALDGAGHAGIGLGGERQGSGVAHAFDGVEHGYRPDTAIDAENIDIPFGEAGGKVLRVGAVEAVSILVNGDLGDDGHVGVDLAAGEHSLMQFFHIAEGFEDQQIDSTFDQSGNLLAKSGTRLFERNLAEGFDTNAERAYRAGDPASEALGCLASQVSAGDVDVAYMAGQTVAGQAKAVGTEGIGFNDLGAGLQIVVVHASDQVGLGNVQLVIATVDENALGVEEGTHGSIAEHRPLLQTFAKVLRHLQENTGRRRLWHLGPGRGGRLCRACCGPEDGPATAGKTRRYDFRPGSGPGGGLRDGERGVRERREIFGLL